MYGTLENTSQPRYEASGGAYDEPFITSAASPPIPQGLTVPRDHLIKVVGKRAERSANCRMVPLSLALYIFTCALIILHGHAEVAYDMESMLNAVAINGGDNGGFKEEVFSANSWVEFFAGYGASDSSVTTPVPNDSGWLNYVISNRDNGKNIGNVNSPLRGRIRDSNVIVGGIHLTQRRRSTVNCTVPNLIKLFGDCHAGTSLAQFGDADQYSSPDGKYNVASAFSPLPVLTTKAKATNTSFAFQFWLDSHATLAVNQAYLIQLDRAGWLDASTKDVTVEFSVVNGETGFVGRVALLAAFTLGGRVETTASVTSVPLDPYFQYPVLQVLDTFAVIYLVYLILSLALASAKFARARDWGRLFGFWNALDASMVGTLIAAIAQYAALIVSLQATNASIDPNASARDYSSGPNPLGVHALAACTQFETFKSTCVVFLVLSTARLFYYFTFQPRLAVFPDAFSRAFPDIFHFTVVFSVVLTLFGVWGHFQFGALAPDWHTVGGSIISVFRFMQYDYDLVIMEDKNRWFADAFFVFALYGVTNLFLWALVGIILEAYSVVMNERAGCPTVFDEGAELAGWVYSSLTNPTTSIRWLSVAANVPSPRAYGAGGGGADTVLPPYSVILASLLPGGPLCTLQDITPEVFAAALGVSLPTAAYLIAQVRAMRPGDVNSGWAPPLPKDVEAALGQLAGVMAAQAAGGGSGAGGGGGGGGYWGGSPGGAPFALWRAAQGGGGASTSSSYAVPGGLGQQQPGLLRSKTAILTQVAAGTDRARESEEYGDGDNSWNGAIAGLTTLVKGLSAQVGALQDKLAGGGGGGAGGAAPPIARYSPVAPSPTAPYRNPATTAGVFPGQAASGTPSPKKF